MSNTLGDRRQKSASSSRQTKSIGDSVISKAILRRVSRNLENHFNYEILENSFVTHSGTQKESLVLYNFPASREYQQFGPAGPQFVKPKVKKSVRHSISNPYIRCLVKTTNEVMAKYPVAKLNQYHVTLPVLQSPSDAVEAAEPGNAGGASSSPDGAVGGGADIAADHRRQDRREQQRQPCRRSAQMSPRRLQNYRPHVASMLNTQHYLEFWNRQESAHYPLRQTKSTKKGARQREAREAAKLFIEEPEPRTAAVRQESNLASDNERTPVESPRSPAPPPAVQGEKEEPTRDEDREASEQLSHVDSAEPQSSIDSRQAKADELEVTGRGADKPDVDESDQPEGSAQVNIKLIGSSAVESVQTESENESSRSSNTSPSSRRIAGSTTKEESATPESSPTKTLELSPESGPTKTSRSSSESSSTMTPASSPQLSSKKAAEDPVELSSKDTDESRQRPVNLEDKTEPGPEGERGISNSGAQIIEEQQSGEADSSLPRTEDPEPINIAESLPATGAESKPEDSPQTKTNEESDSTQNAESKPWNSDPPKKSGSPVKSGRRSGYETDSSLTTTGSSSTFTGDDNNEGDSSSQDADDYTSSSDDEAHAGPSRSRKAPLKK